MTSLQSTEHPTAASARPGSRRRRGWQGLTPALVVVLCGCVSVKAPDKPIVIELNVNIRQEVVYRLAEDAGNTIQGNPDIF